MTVKMTEEPEDFEGKWPDPRERSAPARREEMAKFAAELKADPAKALKFFQEAGILNERGELTPQYGGPAAPQVVVHHKTPPIVSDMTLKFTAVPLVQPEPAGYFERWDGHWDQVAAEFNDDADVYPLYLHPPATEVQRLIDAAKSVWDSAVAHDRVLNRHTKVSPVALDCLRAALDALEGM